MNASPETSLVIGEALRAIRSRKGVKQEELARRTGLTVNFLSLLENGKKGVSHRVVERIAEALDVPVSFLYLLADRSDNPLVTDLKAAVLRSLTQEGTIEGIDNSETSCKGQNIPVDQLV
jgi:transcriptional regulator with XRE-family HTH domain